MDTRRTQQDSRGASPSRVWIVLAFLGLIWLVFAAVVFSNLEVDALVFLAMGASGMVIALVWLIAWAILVRANTRGRERVGRFTIRGLMRVSVAPICGLIGVWMLWTDVDFLVRFRLSESALIARCESMQADPESAGIRDEWIGLFRVRHGFVENTGAVRLALVYPWMFDEYGVVYDPDGEVEEIGHGSEQRSAMFGPWMRYTVLD